MRSRLPGTADYAPLLRTLRQRSINYDPQQVRPQEWNFDVRRHTVAWENPGEPEPEGPWHHACRLVADYEFTDPSRIRAIYQRDDPLLGRTMLLEGRFYGLRFYMGVRISDVIDDAHDGQRVWGWAYRTLQGHLERGQVTYLVIKHKDSGLIEFVVSGYSQVSPNLGRLTRVGWTLFGRRTQLRFYERCGIRLRAIIDARPHGQRLPVPESRGIDDLVLAPSDSEPHALERITLTFRDPAN